MADAEALVTPLARAFLREEFGTVDAALPAILEAVKATGAAECWHKHSSFLSHLQGVHRMACLWGLPRDVCLCALLHSAYSNSYVNLALFAPAPPGRDAVRALAGDAAERWTWLFCRVPRHALVYTRLVDPLVYGIASADAPADAPPPPHSLLGWHDAPPAYALPSRGALVVQDIRSSEDIALDAYEVGTLLALSVADFAEQWHGWQDALFGTAADGGRLRYGRGGSAHALWPGDGRPDLFLHTLSHMARLVVAANEALAAAGDARRVPLPAVFARSTRVVSAAEEAACRDAYWRAATQLHLPAHAAEAEAALRAAVAACAAVGEPFVLLAQLRLQAGRFEDAAAAAAEGLALLLAWGTSWDKRMPWGAWVAWARVLARAAKDRAWPAADAPFGVINLGLVGH